MNLVWAFDVGKAVEKDGTVIEPNLTDYLEVRVRHFTVFMLVPTT